MWCLHIYYPKIIYSINVSEIFWSLHHFRVRPTSDCFRPSPLSKVTNEKKGEVLS
jgi:hypothetical protein